MCILYPWTHISLGWYFICLLSPSKVLSYWHYILIAQYFSCSPNPHISCTKFVLLFFIIFVCSSHVRCVPFSRLILVVSYEIQFSRWHGEIVNSTVLIALSFVFHFMFAVYFVHTFFCLFASLCLVYISLVFLSFFFVFWQSTHQKFSFNFMLYVYRVCIKCFIRVFVEMCIAP